MKIAILAPFDEAIPPQKYGGIERIIYSLVKGLVAKGHDITLFCAGKPDVPCRVISIFPHPLRTIEPYMSDLRVRDAAKYVGIAKVLSILEKEKFDLFHNHLGWRLLPFHSMIHIPMISTIHNPVVAPLEKLHFTIGSDLLFVSISNRQQELAPTIRFAATVYNGIDLASYPFSSTHDDYLLFLGRISPDKGTKEAIEVAKRTGKKLIIAAQVDVPDKAYYEYVQSHIDGKQIISLGEIDLSTKVTYLQKAAALISPIQWEEPFGLVAIEAMACGTPVLGMARGAYPEIVEQGKQGYLSTTVDEMISHVKDIDHIDRHACRARVEERFTVDTMINGYEAVYKSILS